MNNIIRDRVVSIVDSDPDPAIILRAAENLRAGELIVAPTETRYGLLARADSQSALERILLAKGRPENMPVSVFFDSLDGIAEAGDLTSQAKKLILKFMPGPLTIILKATSEWPKPIAPQGKIGIRFSSSRVIAALLSAVGVPLTATSANLSGRKDNEKIDDIYIDLGDRVSLYLDSGPLQGLPSTVVDCTGDEFSIVREGAVTTAQIDAALLEAGQ